MAFGTSGGRQCSQRGLYNHCVSSASSAFVGVAKEELRLQSIVASALKQQRGDWIAVVREIDSWSGIVDVLALSATAESWAHLTTRHRAAISRLTPAGARLLARLPCSRYVTVDELVASLGVSRSTLLRYIRILRAAGLIKVRGTSARRIKNVRNLVRVLAIEVKVKDWRQGFYQAMRYRAFSNEVALALPLSVAKRVKKRCQRMIRDFRIGLIGIDEVQRELKWLVRPRSRRPASASNQLICLAQLLRRRSIRSALSNGTPR